MNMKGLLMHEYGYNKRLGHRSHSPTVMVVMLASVDTLVKNEELIVLEWKEKNIKDPPLLYL